MKLMAEIPKQWLKDLSPLHDGDFALAQLVLQDEEYRTFYRNQADQKRLVILDNGFHELGYPLTSVELVEAATLINASVVIAPDKLGNLQFGIDEYDTLHDLLPSQFLRGAVLVGASPAERAEFFMRVYKTCHMLCLPYRENRLGWLQELYGAIPKYVTWPSRIHLLGVRDLHELSTMRNFLDDLGVPARRVSVDTSKHLKFAILKQKLTVEEKSLRGTGPLAELEKKIIVKDAAEQKSLAYYNTAFLRKFL